MSNLRPPTRKELSAVFKDQRTLRAIEDIFNLIPSELDSVSSDSQVGIATANLNSSLIEKQERRIKSTGVLLWLSM